MVVEEKGSPSEGSEITAVVISVADNIERVFLSLASIWRGFTLNVTEAWKRFSELYRNTKEVCHQLGVKNQVENNLS